jgi:hypothetical protein
LKTTPAPGLEHRAQRREELGGSPAARGRPWLVEDENPRAVEEHLQDLDALLLTDRELPDPGARIHGAADVAGQIGDALLGRPQVDQEPRLVESPGARSRSPSSTGRARSAVDHPDAGRDGVARRAEVDGLAADADRALVRPYRPARTFMSVLLPAPFSPSNAWISPTARRSRRGRWR